MTDSETGPMDVCLWEVCWLEMVVLANFGHLYVWMVTWEERWGGEGCGW